jgi:hypothetical protein
MMIQIKGEAQVENPRQYEARAVEHLRHLLELGAPAQRDPGRENFYEIDGQTDTFYVHLSPLSGNVVLVAKWLRQAEDCCLSAAHFTA